MAGFAAAHSTRQETAGRLSLLKKALILFFAMYMARHVYHTPFHDDVDVRSTTSSIRAAAGTSTIMSIAEQDEWIRTKFRAHDPSEQEWCRHVLSKGTFWHDPEYGNKGAQFSQDVFIFRRLFLENNKKGFYVEAGANHYMELSTTYFYDKCLGWDGICIEPQVQYHDEIEENRSCRLIKQCLATQKTEMMIGGMPAHRGGGMYVKPIPEDGIIPENWSRVECSPLDEMLSGRTDVDLLVLDVEGAEMMLLETIKWDKLLFNALLIEDNKMSFVQKRKLNNDMAARGYPKLHQMRIDSLFAPKHAEARSRQEIWQPEGNIVELKS